MRKVIPIILFNITILGVGLLLIEIIWRTFYANNIRFSVNVLADTHYNYDISSLYSLDSNIISYSRDIYGFRGEYSQLEDIDILVVGGSTTDQRYVDDKKEWTYILSSAPFFKENNITVVNAGVDGQSSFGHIKNFDLWFSKIDSLQPKYILFYVGLNDFYKDAGYSDDNLEKNSTTKEIIKGSFSYYVYRLIKGMALTVVYGVGHKRVDIQSLKVTLVPLLEEREYEPLMRINLAAYLNRLNILWKKTRELGATPIFVTQRKMNHWKKDNQIFGIDEEYYYGNTKYNGVDAYYMEKLLNATTMSICKDHSDSICIDLASDIKFIHNDFYDYGHNTPSGAAKIGNYLADKIKSFY